jgi:hypothetical protein
MTGFRRIAIPAAALALVLGACSDAETGVTQGHPNEPVIVLSEGACPHDTCPVYDMTLHEDGSYILNGERYVKSVGVSDGNLGPEAWMMSSKVLEDAQFWGMATPQTAARLPNCQPDAPTIQVTWRTDKGKEKTLVYDAGCGVAEVRDMISRLRAAMQFEKLVWTNEKFKFDPAAGH